MREEDDFWHLTGASSINCQAELYEHLIRSDHLKDTIYTPDEFRKEMAERPTRIKKKKFERVSFSKTLIVELIFHHCVFDRCQFIGAEIRNCEFHNCTFISTNTHKISISNTYINPLSFERCLDPENHQNIGVHLYHELLNNSRREEQIEFERDARFLFLRWKRFQDSYEISKLWTSATSSRDYRSLIPRCSTYIRRFLWEKIFGSGLRIKYFVVTVALIEALFSVSSFVFRDALGLTRSDMPISSFWEALYFTTISLTTLGYGDIVPTTSVGLLFAAVQSVIGFFLFALLASMLFRRVSP